MAKITKEELTQLSEHSKQISVAQLSLENSQLVLELEKSKFEIFKLNIFRKYNLTDDMYIDREGNIQSKTEDAAKDVTKTLVKEAKELVKDE